MAWNIIILLYSAVGGYLLVTYGQYWFFTYPEYCKLICSGASYPLLHFEADAFLLQLLSLLSFQFPSPSFPDLLASHLRRNLLRYRCHRCRLSPRARQPILRLHPSHALLLALVPRPFRCARYPHDLSAQQKGRSGSGSSSFTSRWIVEKTLIAASCSCLRIVGVRQRRSAVDSGGL